jgi:hypothetical protein
MLEWFWFSFGICFARCFGKTLDQDIQNSEWFKALSELEQWIVEHLLDFTHHWWIGALLVLYGGRVEIIWFGWGLILDDLPDVPARFGIKWVKEKLYS